MKKLIAGCVTLGLLVLAPVNIADASTSLAYKAPAYKIVLSNSVGQKQTTQVNTVKTPVIKVVKVTTINLQKSNSKPAPTPSPVPESKPSTPVIVPETKPTPTPTPVPNPAPAPEATLDEFSSLQKEMLNYINTERAKANLAPLTLDKELSAGAYLKSKDMAVNNYFSHTSPTYGSPFQMMRDRGITYRMAAENIAKSTSLKTAHNALMNSSGHRANILNSGFSKLGLGIYQEGRYLYITQWFTN